MTQAISIKTYDENNNFIGTFKISYDKPINYRNAKNNFKRSSSYYSSLFNKVHSHMNVILDNIPISTDIDNKTPIQYLKNISDESVNIFLLEETSYTLSFESKNSVFSNEDVFFSLKNFDNNVYSPIDTKNKRFFTGLLNFHSYVGKSFLDIRKDGKTISKIPIEVRSKKINYQDQYPAMISDLSEHISSIIFDSKSPLFQSFDLIDSNKTSFYEDYMYLEYLFREENLPSTFEYLSKNLYSQLEEYTETVPISFASNIGPNELINIFSNPKNLHKIPNDGYVRNKKIKDYIPDFVDEIRYKDNIDVPENRFYKNFLELIDYLIEKLIDKSSDGYIKDKLLSFQDEINYYLSEQYFKDISLMDYEPLNSQVLQKKEGYREILQYFLMLEFSYRMKYEWDDLDKTFKGYEKRLSELYELWSYFELLSIIENLTNTNLHKEDLFELNGLNINLKKGNNSIIKSNLYVSNKLIPIEFMYNKLFTGGKGSYSVNLKPDYSIKFKINNKYYYIHFDAKYKFNIDNFGNEVYKDIDIYKMHTYRDAIKNTIGSYVLYPGDIKKLFPEDNLGLVGAFPLNPGHDENEKLEISKFIYKLIESLLN